MEAQGAEIVEISAPHFEYGVAAYYLILPAEASSNLAKFDSVRFGLRVTPAGTPTVESVMAATRDAGFGDEVKRRIILGTYALSAGYYDAYYGSAQKVRTLIQRDFDAAFAQVDVIATPSAPTTAFRLGEKIDDPLQMYLNDVTTIPANLAGVPGISIPSGSPRRTGCPSASSSSLPPARMLGCTASAPRSRRCSSTRGAARCWIVHLLRGGVGLHGRRTSSWTSTRPSSCYEPVLGFEVHVELNTKTKMFSAAPELVRPRTRTPTSRRSIWACPARCRS